jgi:hypothetical protein
VSESNLRRKTICICICWYSICFHHYCTGFIINSNKVNKKSRILTCDYIVTSEADTNLKVLTTQPFFAQQVGYGCHTTLTMLHCKLSTLCTPLLSNHALVVFRHGFIEFVTPIGLPVCFNSVLYMESSGFLLIPLHFCCDYACTSLKFGPHLFPYCICCI